MRKITALIIIVMACLMSHLAPADKLAEVNAAIKSCETYVAYSIAAQKEFPTMTKPGPFTSSTNKKKYQIWLIKKRVFEQKFAELMAISNLKINVHNAQSVDDFSKALPLYQRNCNSLGAYLPLFVIWAAKGSSGSKTVDIVFQDWFDEVANMGKCGKRTC